MLTAQRPLGLECLSAALPMADALVAATASSAAAAAMLPSSLNERICASPRGGNRLRDEALSACAPAPDRMTDPYNR